ncbi:MAG: DUF1343 domain-containing protein [Saprospiraceae bacterium]|nr:DUF1343 domain-containing protein [Saprospiraceae bacterium]
MENKKWADFFLKTMLLVGLLYRSSTLFTQTNIVESDASLLVPPPAVVVGAERMPLLLPQIHGKNVGLVVNHSSLVGSAHLVDTLCALGECVSRIFVPEHGFRGTADAGEMVKDGQDARTGTPIVSLYGKKKKPSPADLREVDVVVFDIQDVGARFYTYISTLYYVLEACAEQGKPVVVLDRPNPNGHYVDGPVLDMRLASFVGVAPLPIVHGCTMGELARLFAGEYWFHQAERLDLRVIPCERYTHQTPYDLPVKPSPNLPNTRAVLLYPSLCLFEGTVVSVGRGTDWPFQIVGAPEFAHDSFWFVPRPSPGARHPLHQGWVCKGFDLRQVSVDSLRAQKQLSLGYLLDFYRQYPNKPSFFLKNKFFDQLAGTYSLRKQIEEGKSEAEIRATWQADLEAFREIRKKYLLYAD